MLNFEWLLPAMPVKLDFHYDFPFCSVRFILVDKNTFQVCEIISRRAKKYLRVSCGMLYQ